MQQLREPAEAARILRVKEGTLSQWRWLGRGPRFRKIGGAVRYHPDDLAEYIERQVRTSTSDPGTRAAGGDVAG